MLSKVTRRGLLLAAGCAVLMAAVDQSPASAADKVVLRLSSVISPTDQRAIGLSTIFGPAITDFATFEPHWNGTLFKQGTELEAIARGNLEMNIASAQEFSEFFPEFTVFTAGYLFRDAAHQVAVFRHPLMDPFKKKVEDKLKVKLLSVIYLGRRQVNLRTESKVMTPADLAGVKLRMPNSEAWQFLGSALGANPVPLAFPEVYTALQTGAIDGQDNPLPTDKDSKFYEVTKQIILTSHLVDFNYLTLSKKVWDGFTPKQQQIVQKAADDAMESARQKQLQLEDDLAKFFVDKGMKVYKPDVDAFRKHVQEAYRTSKYAKDWPQDIVEKINAVK